MNVLPSDPALGKMNAARWLFMHQILVDRERKDIRKWARFFGTDTAAFSETEKEEDESQPVKAIPLAAILNPEAFGRLVQQEQGTSESFVADEEYERQVAALEKGGLLTDIDSVLLNADEKLKDKQEQAKKEKIEAATDPNYLKKIDKLAEEVEQRAKKKGRVKII